MNINDWGDAFLSEFYPEDDVENFKKAKMQNTMLYFQFHVGLVTIPTGV